MQPTNIAEAPPIKETGVQQIIASMGVGLPSEGPLPPVVIPATVFQGIVKGKQIAHRFPAHIDLINVLSWDSPAGVDHFNVYRGNLSSLIATTKAPYYEDHQRIPKKGDTYLITSIDERGQESTPMTIVVVP